MERKRIRKYILLLLLVICAVPLIAHFVRAWRIGDICNNITISSFASDLGRRSGEV